MEYPGSHAVDGLWSDAVACTLRRVDRLRRAAVIVVLLAGCGHEELPDGPRSDAGEGDAPAFDASEPDAAVVAEKDAGQLADSGELGLDTGIDPPIEEGPTGFIGAPCKADTDCTYEGGVCLTDGFPRGSCSLACDRFCPDRAGSPTTFCVATSELPSAGDLSSVGACVSRCDFGEFPEAGCRPDYGCVETGRVNEPAIEVPVCLPGATPDLGDCLQDLAAAGVDFEPTTIADQVPDGYPNLRCHVEMPVIIHPPIHGIDLKYYDASPTPNIRAACNMALALSKSIDDVAARGVVAVRHIGTYNCRVIAGTDRLSRHAYGDAIDVYGFELADGSLYTLVDHWEHDTTSPVTPAGMFLYDTAHRWHDQRLWTIILTPNYNAAHDNHIHVDLTPGSDFIGLLPLDDFGYLGPAPYDD